MAHRGLDQLVEQLRAAAAARATEADSSADRSKAIRAVLQKSLEDREPTADAIAAIAEDELLLHEDETCSIWSCRYDTETVLAPHEHCMAVHIAVYRGTELEVLYKREANRLRHGGNKPVSAGQLVSLGADAIHAVTADGEGQSHAIHVYEGPLTTIERSLFDWETGDKVAFTMENFHAMARRKQDMSEFNS